MSVRAAAALVLVALTAVAASSSHLTATPQRAQTRPSAARGARLLYVALPDSERDPDQSVRLLVFDAAAGHRFVRRVPLWAHARSDSTETVRGLAADAGGGRLYISTTARLAAVDLKTDAVVWEKRYDQRCCDRFAVSPDGSTIYAPAFGKAQWYVVRAADGALRATIPVTGWPRQTAYSRDGARVYLGAWESPLLTVVDGAGATVVRTVGPFSGSLCPFALNARGTLAFANVDGLVGFEVADTETGLILDSVAVEGIERADAGDYECPSHGIAFGAGDRELWVADGVRNRLVVFDATMYPPVQTTAIGLPSQPRWLAFGSDGRFVYSSTGDVVEAATKKIVAVLEAPRGVRIVSSVLVEIVRPPS
jgi:DNA-binding beta-propeller fold protein YncE